MSRCANWPCAKPAGHSGSCSSTDEAVTSNLVTRLRDLSNRLRDSGRYTADECDLAAASLIDEAIAALPAETKAPLTQCPYCKRPARDDGSIFHEAGCAGLEPVHINQLEYDRLVPQRSAVKATEEFTWTQGPTNCGGSQKVRVWHGDGGPSSREEVEDCPGCPDCVPVPQDRSAAAAAGLPFVHWSKDPLVPYSGCGCSSCMDAQGAVKTSADPHGDLEVEQS